MIRDKIAGYACPICNTANSVSNTYCSHCGHWLFDTEREAKPLSKKEFKKRKKKQGNAYYRMMFMQIWAIVIMLIELLAKSQRGFDFIVLLYLLSLAIFNLKSGKTLAELQKQTKEEA